MPPQKIKQNLENNSPLCRLDFFPKNNKGIGINTARRPVIHVRRSANRQEYSSRYKLISACRLLLPFFVSLNFSPNDLLELEKIPLRFPLAQIFECCLFKGNISSPKLVVFCNVSYKI